MNCAALLDTVPQQNDYAQRDAVELELVDPCASPAWDREALTHPDCTAFHSSAWAGVLARTYRHTPRYCRFTRSGKLLGLIPLMDLQSPISGRRGVSLPFTDYCQPLIFSGADSDLIVEKLTALAREHKWKYLEIRGDRLAPPSANPAVAFYGHSVELSSVNDLFATFEPSVRRAIRKAERAALEARIAFTAEAMRQFYRLHAATRRRHGLPPQPLSFFLNIQEQLIEKGLGFISLVLSGVHAVAAAVFFHQGRKAIYKFGASDDAYQNDRPNNLAMWRAMKHLAESGFDSLHMGRTSIENDGLRQFKLGWGARESRIEYFKFDTGSNAWATSSDRVAGAHNAIFSRMPLSINRLMGRLIYPHLD